MAGDGSDDGSDDGEQREKRPKVGAVSSEWGARLFARMQKSAIQQLADDKRREAWEEAARARNNAPQEHARPLDAIEAAVPKAAIPGYWESLTQNARTWAQEMSVSPEWTAAQTNLAQWRAVYTARAEASLTPTAGLPSFTGKTMPRLQEKVVREVGHNGIGSIFIGNSSVPRINDLVRVRIATSYLDGVDFLATRLELRVPKTLT